MRNIISIPRGNTYKTRIIPTIDGINEYILQLNDEIYFSVAVSPNINKIILNKTLTLNDYIDNELILTLNPEDTVNLQEYKYCFDVAIKFANDDFYTFIYPETSDFIITGAISQPSSEPNQEEVGGE